MALKISTKTGTDIQFKTLKKGSIFCYNADILGNIVSPYMKIENDNTVQLRTGCVFAGADKDLVREYDAELILGPLIEKVDK